MTDVHYRTDSGWSCFGPGVGDSETRDQAKVTCPTCQLWLNANGHLESTNPAPRAVKKEGGGR